MRSGPAWSRGVFPRCPHPAGPYSRLHFNYFLPEANESVPVPSFHISKNLHRYYWHPTDRSMFEQFTCKFFYRLQQRGHAVNKRAKLFLYATIQANASLTPLPKPANDQLGGPDGTCFLYLQYHLQDTPRCTLPQLFKNDTCLEAFKEEGVPISRITVAYKRSSNIAKVTRWNGLNNAVNTINLRACLIVRRPYYRWFKL
jgi:hypothetical protein